MSPLMSNLDLAKKEVQKVFSLELELYNVFINVDGLFL
jgi:hypothetical protein